MPELKLPKKAQVFIVTSFATYEAATEIQKLVKENFGVELTLQGVAHYNPEANKTIAAKWKTLFDETREKFNADTSNIAIASKAFRLRELERHYRRQTSAARVNPVELRATLEQAAKESGGGYTNRREITGPEGKSIVPDGANVILYLPDNGRGDADRKPASADNAEPGDTAG
jgi:hypothetical protein